jgi:hypothetical protein
MSISPANLYSALPPGSKSIRLLDLEAPRSSIGSGTLRGLDTTHCEGDGSDALYGSLRVVSLADSPSFTALSYVWGEAEPRTTIFCDGHQLVITPNCFDALYVLRKRYGRLSIWVDAICINQQDDDEKSAQVSLMEDIYSWAENVYVWLGRATLESDAAIKYFTIAPKHHGCVRGADVSARSFWSHLKLKGLRKAFSHHSPLAPTRRNSGTSSLHLKPTIF